MLSKQMSIAARALLGWSQPQAARHTTIGERTLAEFERGRSTLRPETEGRVRAAFDAWGISFVDEGSRRPGIFIDLDKFDAALTADAPPVVEVEAVEVEAQASQEGPSI